MKAHLSSVMVICTRNRRQDLERALSSLLAQTRDADLVLVVDSSDGDESRQLCEKIIVEDPSRELKYIHTERGLTRQRNEGLKHVTDLFDVVHFIDDDVELEPSYIASLMDVFELQPAVTGAGGSVLGSIRKAPRIIARLGLRDSVRAGAVLKSGFNIGCYDHPQSIRVDWLPGCSMSFRLGAIGEALFDENRTGYALGEDVDFGLKMSSRGLLVHCPDARLFHHLSTENRHDKPTIVRMGVAHRMKLAHDFPDRVTKLGVIYGTLSEAVSLYYKGLRGRDVSWLRAGNAAISALFIVLAKTTGRAM